MKYRAIVAAGMRRHLDLREPMAEQQRDHALLVRRPPIGAIIGQFLSWIKNHRWNLQVSKVQVRFDDQQLFGERRDFRECLDRVIAMIENPQIQHDIECADPFRREIRYVDFSRFNVRAKR